MVYNTVSGALFKDAETVGIMVIPVYFRQEFVIWKDRDSGGGFFGAYHTEQEANDHIVAEGMTDCEVVKTDQHFCLVLCDGKWEEVIISMGKAKLKASRQLNSLIRIGGGDRFSRVYRFNSMVVDGPKGEYYNWKVNAVGYAPEDAYRQAENLYNSVVAGERGINYGEKSKSEDVSDSIG